jgi:hypothetical protein
MLGRPGQIDRQTGDRNDGGHSPEEKAGNPLFASLVFTLFLRDRFLNTVRE